MQPATVSYRSLDGTTDAVLTSPAFAARLLSAGKPDIAARFEADRITFLADTPELVLRSRVSDLLEDVLGPGWRRHVAREA